MAGAEPQRVRSDQEILIQLERDWDAALHRGDAEFIETILADEYISTYPDGSRGDKAKELAKRVRMSTANTPKDKRTDLPELLPGWRTLPSAAAATWECPPARQQAFRLSFGVSPGLYIAAL